MSFHLKPPCLPIPSPANPPPQLILLGANDASVPRDTENQAVPLDEYKQNLSRIVTHPHITAHSPKILLITPPPCDEIRTAELDIPRRGHNTHISARQATYSQAARDVAAAVKGVVVVDAQKALMEYAVARTPGWEDGGKKGVLGDPESGEKGYLEKLLPDGLHLSGEAYRVIWGLVEKEIEVPADGGEGYVFPEWKEAEWLKE